MTDNQKIEEEKEEEFKPLSITDFLAKMNYEILIKLKPY